MIIIKKPNRKYLYLRYYHPIREINVDKSTGLEDTPENRLKIENEIMPAIQIGLKTCVQKPIEKKLSNYINFYLKSKENLSTYREIEAKSILILEHFGDIEIKDITPLMCKTYILNLELASKTKRNYLNVLSGIFDVACEDREIVENPCKFIKIIKGEDEIDEVEPFSKNEVEIILSNADGLIKDFLGVAFYTGARSGEILGLTIQDIDFENKTIAINKQYTRNKLKNKLKANKGRVIPLFDAVVPYLNNLIGRCSKTKSFNLFAKEGEPNKILSIDNIRGKKPYGVWNKLLKSCDIKYRKIYNTRHSFAVQMLKSGNVSASEIAQILGHTNTKTMFESYAKHIKGEQLKIERDFDIFGSKNELVDTLVDSGHIKEKLSFQKEA